MITVINNNAYYEKFFIMKYYLLWIIVRKVIRADGLNEGINERKNNHLKCDKIYDIVNVVDDDDNYVRWHC